MERKKTTFLQTLLESLHWRKIVNYMYFYFLINSYFLSLLLGTDGVLRIDTDTGFGGTLLELSSQPDNLDMG